MVSWGRNVLAYLRLEVSFLRGGKHICRRDVQMHERLPERRPVARLTLPKREDAMLISEAVSGRWGVGDEALFCFMKYTFYSKNCYIPEGSDVLKYNRKPQLG